MPCAFRSNSLRKKIIPTFEPLCESTTENQETSLLETTPIKDDISNRKQQQQDLDDDDDKPPPPVTTPDPVNIVSEGSEQDFLGEDISSSSEIEIIEIEEDSDAEHHRRFRREEDQSQEVPSSPEDTLKVCMN